MQRRVVLVISQTAVNAPSMGNYFSKKTTTKNEAFFAKKWLSSACVL